MVEAMYERSPGYFKQFQINFRFFITEEKPKSTFAKVSAICMHTDSLFCGVLPANHYDVLFDVSDVATDFLRKTKLYSVPCLYTTFNCFFLEWQGLGENWYGFRKIEASCGIQWSNVTDEGKYYKHSKTFTQFGQWRWLQNSAGSWKYCFQNSRK